MLNGDRALVSQDEKSSGDGGGDGGSTKGSTYCHRTVHLQMVKTWPSPAIRWMGVHLLTQGIRVRSLVPEDSTCHRATMPMCHNYWAHVLQLSKPVHLEPVLYRRSQGNETPHALQPESSPRLPQQEKALGQQQRPQAAKNQINNFVKVVKT